MPLVITSNEAGLIGAFGAAAISALTSVLVTRYILKKSPDYKSQIEQVNATLDARIAQVSLNLGSRIQELTQAHTAHSAQQASFQQEEVARQKDARWRPEALMESTTEGNAQKNVLVLKSTQLFCLISVSLQTSAGATIADIPIDKEQNTTGYRVPVTHQNLLKLKQSANAGGLAQGIRGQLAYVVLMNDQRYEFTLPVITKDLIVENTLVISLIG